MIKASEEQVIAAFEKVHGKLKGECYAEIIYDEDFDIAGVACMKDGVEAWRATLAEIAFDLAIESYII